MVANLVRFSDVLDLWSSRTNLVSCGSARELVERHFLDSLAVAPLLPEAGIIVDLGTGAGFPGLPLAIVRPAQRFVLVESRRRRVSFLHEVRRTLGMANVEVVESRAEEVPSQFEHGARSVVSRAVWSDESFLDMASRWLEPDGRVFWMRSEPLPGSLRRSPFRPERSVGYRIGRERARSVEILRLSR
jgi:16S rRNA (guanine527-N7)-methyltransferase